MTQDIKQILDEAAARINVPSFVVDDPVQFPRRFGDQRDIEVVALLVSHISWGRRPMILRDAERLLAMMEGVPHRWLMEGGYDLIPDGQNIHRTFFGRDLKYMCRGLARVYGRCATLEDFASQNGVARHWQPAWELARLLNAAMDEANASFAPSRYCLPRDCDKTALKRLNMALRWLVRDDGIVDLGVWRAMAPSQLFIPLDVHVGNTARRLGLVTRRQDDKRTVIELTDCLRAFRPHDPVYYDFALFGLGVNGDA